MQAGWKAILCLVRDFPNIRNLVEVGFQLNQLGVLPDQLVLRACFVNQQKPLSRRFLPIFQQAERKTHVIDWRNEYHISKQSF
jgi:hypothetical protein